MTLAETIGVWLLGMAIIAVAWRYFNPTPPGKDL